MNCCVSSRDRHGLLLGTVCLYPSNLREDGAGSRYETMVDAVAEMLEHTTEVQMRITKQQIQDVIYSALEEVNEQLPDDKQMPCSPETVLLGDDGGLDSLGFVNFIGLVEDGLESRLKCYSGLSETDISFETVQDLVELIHSNISQH